MFQEGLTRTKKVNYSQPHKDLSEIMKRYNKSKARIVGRAFRPTMHTYRRKSRAQRLAGPIRVDTKELTIHRIWCSSHWAHPRSSRIGLVPLLQWEVTITWVLRVMHSNRMCSLHWITTLARLLSIRPLEHLRLSLQGHLWTRVVIRAQKWMP
jgi:hypothetical protein